MLWQHNCSGITDVFLSFVRCRGDLGIKSRAQLCIKQHHFHLSSSLCCSRLFLHYCFQLKEKLHNYFSWPSGLKYFLTAIAIYASLFCFVPFLPIILERFAMSTFTLYFWHFGISNLKICLKYQHEFQIIKPLSWKKKPKLSISSNVDYVTECIELVIKERIFFFFLIQEIIKMAFIKKIRKGINEM